MRGMRIVKWLKGREGKILIEAQGIRALSLEIQVEGKTALLIKGVLIRD